MFSRKVITRSGRGFRGRYPSLKCGRMVAFESLLELAVMLLMEFSSEVVSYREQPELVLYNDGDSVKKYFPDFEVVLTSGAKAHVEVKPSQKLESPKVAKTYQAIAAHYLRFRRERFLIVTEQEARAEPLYSNLKMLSAIRAKSKVSQSSQTKRLKLFQPTGWSALESELGRDQLLRHLALGHFCCDLRKPLEGNLLVFTEGEACDSLFL